MRLVSKGKDMGHVYRFDEDKTLHVIHAETGVVLASLPRSEGRAKESSYMKMYIESAMHLAILFGGKAGVLFAVLSLAGRDGEIVLRASQKAMVCEKLGLSQGTVSNYISALLKDGLLYKLPGETGPIYWANPGYFAIGSWNDVKERMALYEVARRMYSRGRQDSPDSTGGIGGDSPDDVLPVEPCEGQA